MRCRIALPALLLLVVFLLDSTFATGGPPTGKRSTRPRATHVLITETRFQGEGGLSAMLPAGTRVALSRPAARPAKGKVRVVLAEPVEITGHVDSAALGMRIARESELFSTSRKGTVLGRAREGALVRVLPVKAASGRALVEVQGEVSLVAEVDADALTAEARELLVVEMANAAVTTPTEIHAAPDMHEPPVAHLDKGAGLVVVEKDGRAARVRTVGGFVVEGWIPSGNVTLGELAQKKTTPPPPPTHELLVDSPVFPTADSKRPAGILRGGTLVILEPATGARSLVRVTTRGPIVVEGWVRPADLRAVEPIWKEGVR
ncbi:MAG: hypothetical protein HY698_01285 [Deltaproteobacteria bacterium]|nr:hypothetical protein [Deltaproteobacteria bacterium]